MEISQYLWEFTVNIGFIGLGGMGQPMALNLAKAGTPLVAWNRSARKNKVLVASGASVAESPAEGFKQSRLVIVDGAAMDSVLGRGTPEFVANVAQRTIVPRGRLRPSIHAHSKRTFVPSGVVMSRLPFPGGVSLQNPGSSWPCWLESCLTWKQVAHCCGPWAMRRFCVA